MEEPCVTRVEYKEFVKRMEDEHERQNARLRLLEEQTKQFTDIALSVRELAISIKQMAETQKEQGERLEKLEGQDGEMWRKVVGYVITAFVGAVVGLMFKQIGM